MHTQRTGSGSRRGYNEPKLTGNLRRLKPERLIRHDTLGELLIRPIRPDDEAALVEFHQKLSEDTVYTRYFEHMGLEARTRHERLTRICLNSDESFALVLVRKFAEVRGSEICAIGRLSKTEEPWTTNFALLVRDDRQGQGLGKHLLARLLSVARSLGFKTMTGEILFSNSAMRHLCQTQDFTQRSDLEDGLIYVSKAL